MSYPEAFTGDPGDREGSLEAAHSFSHSKTAQCHATRGLALGSQLEHLHWRVGMLSGCGTRLVEVKSLQANVYRQKESRFERTVHLTTERDQSTNRAEKGKALAEGQLTR